MYWISLLFLLTAALTLGIGFLQGGTALLFASIGCSAAAAVIVVVSIVARGKRPRLPE